jgi:hypothetical protein
MLRTSRGARRYNDRITLTKTTATVDAFGHAAVGAPEVVLEVYAQVRQMSATKTMLTFQQADVVGVDLEFRLPAADFDGIVWRGHVIHFPTPEIVDNRGRIVRVSGWYEVDDPAQTIQEG